MTNHIHPTAILPENLVIGQYNRIGANVSIEGFKDESCGAVVIGDCNVIHDNTRIMVGPGGFSMGDWNVIHNHCTFGGPGAMVMGHNCWFGQEVWLDSTGGLTLGNGVRIGLRSHVWSHIASGEQIEGWTIAFQPTVLEDEVWLVGDDVHVASGVRMGARSAAMAHAVVTRDTKPDTVYVGMPAREVSFKLRKDVPLEKKLALMEKWAREFTEACSAGVTVSGERVYIECDGDILVITTRPYTPNPRVTFFDLATKTYTKRLTALEREFYRFIYNNKARFLPVKGAY